MVRPIGKFSKKPLILSITSNFTGEIRFHFEKKTAPWAYYGQECQEDAVVLEIEGVGSTHFRTIEI